MVDVSIVVVDDHPLFRQGVVNTLSLVPGFTPMCCRFGYQHTGCQWPAGDASGGPGKNTDPDSTSNRL